MVLHGIALHDLVSYTIYLACFCVFRFVARAVSRKTPIPLILLYFYTRFLKLFFSGIFNDFLKLGIVNCLFSFVALDDVVILADADLFLVSVIPSHFADIDHMIRIIHIIV